MKNKTDKAKIKKRRQTVQDYEVLREQQKVLYLRQRRKIRKRQMMFYRIKSILRLGSIIFVFLIALYVLLTPLWNVNPLMFTVYPNKSLVIEDNLITSDNQIMAQLKGIKLPNKPIYLLDISRIENNLLKLDPVKKVYIRRYWLPARLKIIILEKQPLFIVSNTIDSDPIYAIATDGSKISNKFLPLPDKYNEEVFNIILNDSGIKWNNQIISKYKEILEIAEVSTGEKLVYLDLRNPKDVYLKMTTSLIRLGEIDATVIQRLSRLKLIIPQVKPVENDLEYIDMRWDKALSLKLKSKKTVISNNNANITSETKEKKQKEETIDNNNTKTKDSKEVIQFQKLLDDNINYNEDKKIDDSKPKHNDVNNYTQNKIEKPIAKNQIEQQQ